MNAIGRRIVVVGTTGSGKTTLARRLADILTLPHIELDALQWEPNWTPARPEVFRERVAEAVTGEAWVADGNYSAVRDIVWPPAETLVWLDYSFVTTFVQLFRRTVRRILTQEELWSGNRERFREQFLSRESLFLWFLRTYFRRRRQVPLVLESPAYAHLNLVRLRSPKETREWLSRLELFSLT
jgi:adenylate kinase family enzyme